MKIQMYFAEDRIDDNKGATPGRKKGEKPIGRESVYSLVRYEFGRSTRKSRERLNLCIFQRVSARDTDNEKR
jgi:hypothetical protein